jgi:hypothetical protein
MEHELRRTRSESAVFDRALAMSARAPCGWGLCACDVRLTNVVGVSLRPHVEQIAEEDAGMDSNSTSRRARMIPNRCGEIPHASATSFEDVRRIGLRVGLVSARRLLFE